MSRWRREGAIGSTCWGRRRGIEMRDGIAAPRLDFFPGRAVCVPGLLVALTKWTVLSDEEDALDSGRRWWVVGVDASAGGCGSNW